LDLLSLNQLSQDIAEKSLDSEVDLYNDWASEFISGWSDTFSQRDVVKQFPEQFWTKRTAYGYRQGDGTEVGTDQIVLKDFLGKILTAKEYKFVMANNFQTDTKLNADKASANKDEKLTPVFVKNVHDSLKG